MKIVNFLIGGVQKGGTTALFEFLKKHPQINTSDKKEVHFFDKRFKKGTKWYHNRFVFEKGKVVGEKSPFYIYWTPCHSRIYSYNKNIKWIILLRNPVDRAYSAYQMEKQRGVENLSFSEAIKAENKRLKVGKSGHWKYSYVNRGFYNKQVKSLYKFFPKQNILFKKSEDLKREHTEVLNDVFDFLRVDKKSDIQQKVIFEGSYERIDNKIRKNLQNIYKDSIVELEQMLNMDFSEWLR